MPRVLAETRTPVPSDIEVAQACVPLRIQEIAEELGLSSEEYDLYGKYKAKAQPDIL